MITQRTLKGREYHSLLQKYCGLTGEIRRLEESFAPHGAILKVDRQRSSLHRKLEVLGESLGKTKDDLTHDMLLTEGNLREYGIDAPLIRLPLVMRYFRYNESNCKIEKFIGKRSIAQQVLFEPNKRKYIAGYARYYSGPTYHEKVKITGKREEITKWKKKPFFTIVFSNWQESWGVEYAPILHRRRLERRANLARDFSLNFYEADNLLGHQHYSSLFLYGVEVSGKRLEEIVNAMRTHQEKYWLTDDELSNPYRYEYLSYESLGVLRGFIYREMCKARKNGMWINFLKVALATMKKIKDGAGEKETEHYKHHCRYCIKDDLTGKGYGRKKAGVEFIREAIEKAKNEKRTKLAKRLETDLSSLIKELI